MKVVKTSIGDLNSKINSHRENQNSSVRNGASKKVVALAIATIATLVLTSCSLIPGANKSFETIEQYQSQSLKWGKCYETFTCAYLKVPIDYTNLELGTFKIALIKYKATQPKEKIGSIVVNPGGPGASGVDYAYNAEYIFDKSVLKKYDLVGFDPRGISRSEPIICLNDKETDAAYAADSKPDSPAEFAALIKASKEYAKKCRENTKYVTHYSTADSARDMDLLRAALGDAKLNFLGKSYGTYLGTLYAQFFPDKVGRMVLDGALNPNITIKEQNLTQTIGFEQALDAFIQDCTSRKDCPLPKELSDARTSFTTLFESAAKSPLTTQSDRVATESLVVLGTAYALYDNETGWPVLRAALRQAKNNEGTAFLELVDEYSARNTDGTYSNNETDAELVIDCLDWHDSRSVAQIQLDAKEFSKRAPVFGPYFSYNSLTCKYFVPAAKDTNTRATNKITSINTAPILIIGTTRDPATPYDWAKSLRKTINGSRLISLDADGHTGHGRGSACVDDAVNAYYLTGVVPVTDLQCTL